MVRLLATMVHEEPSIRQAIRFVQDHCVSGGLHLLFGDQRVPPTPLFARHVMHYYTTFCREAIEAFLTVGFVAYRVRTLENGSRVPEVLPLGTYGWLVARGGARSVPTSQLWSFGPPAKTEEEKEDGDDGGEPLLRYQVSTMYCKEPVYVYEFTRPSPLYPCTSSLACLVPQYMRLRHKRECTVRADLFNSQPSVVFEQQNRTHVNDIVKSDSMFISGGGGTTTGATSSEARDQLSGDRKALGGRQDLYYRVLDDFRMQSHLPEESVTVIAPTNHVVHGLDRVMTPQEMIREELLFIRSIATATGVPPTLLLQGSGAVGTHATSSSAGGGGWADSAESNNRQMLDLCRHINSHLELLMAQAYMAIYGVKEDPRFRLVSLPTFNLEQLSTAFHLRLVDDAVFSSMLEAVWGAPLSEDAPKAREEQRRAEFVLPFRDTPKKK